MTRPNWDDYLMAIAILVSTRSHDLDTQHGAVIVDHHHRILGVGYNGFPRGGSNEAHPTTRPEKYARMVHAETNAIVNCSVRPEQAIMYVTGTPCPRCMQLIIQAGIRMVVFGDRQSVMVGDDERGGITALAENHGVNLVEYSGDCLGVLARAAEGERM